VDEDPRGRFERMWTLHHARVFAYACRAAPDPADLVGDDRGLREAFAGLSSRDREVLALVAWEGLGVREPGVVLGVPTAMASARIHRDRAVVPAAGRERS
jgi:DNA-directed RNA polymerase specialized sigma24 family protein